MAAQTHGRKFLLPLTLAVPAFIRASSPFSCSAAGAAAVAVFVGDDGGGTLSERKIAGFFPGAGKNQLFGAGMQQQLCFSSWAVPPAEAVSILFFGKQSCRLLPRQMRREVKARVGVSTI